MGNCNDKAHGKVTGLDVQPPNPVAGDNITVTATVSIDKVTTAIKSDLVFAKLFHNKFDGCAGATIKAPLGVATVTIPPPGCPLAVTDTAKFIRYVQTSKSTPKTPTTSHLEGTDQDGEPFICVDMTLTNQADGEEPESLVAGGAGGNCLIDGLQCCRGGGGTGFPECLKVASRHPCHTCCNGYHKCTQAFPDEAPECRCGAHALV